MKKIICLIIIVLFVFTLSSCSGKAKMSKRVERMIKDAYSAHLTENNSDDSSDINITYLGKYHKVHCAIIDGDSFTQYLKVGYYYTQDYYVIDVNGIKYPFVGHPGVISVYYKNTYYSLIDAYDQGIFLEEDISKIYDYCMKNVSTFELYYNTLYYPSRIKGESDK